MDTLGKHNRHQIHIIVSCLLLLLILLSGYYAVVELDKYPGSRLIEFYPLNSVKVLPCSQAYSQPMFFTVVYQSSEKPSKIETWYKEHWNSYPKKEIIRFWSGDVYIEADKEVAFRAAVNNPASYYGIVTEFLICRSDN